MKRLSISKDQFRISVKIIAVLVAIFSLFGMAINFVVYPTDAHRENAARIIELQRESKSSSDEYSQLQKTPETKYSAGMDNAMTYVSLVAIVTIISVLCYYVRRRGIDDGYNAPKITTFYFIVAGLISSLLLYVTYAVLPIKFPPQSTADYTGNYAALQVIFLLIGQVVQVFIVAYVVNWIYDKRAENENKHKR